MPTLIDRPAEHIPRDALVQCQCGRKGTTAEIAGHRRHAVVGSACRNKPSIIAMPVAPIMQDLGDVSGAAGALQGKPERLPPRKERPTRESAMTRGTALEYRQPVEIWPEVGTLYKYVCGDPDYAYEGTISDFLNEMTILAAKKALGISVNVVISRSEALLEIA